MKLDEKKRVVLLDGDDVATAIDAYITAHRICVSGPRTIRLRRRDELFLAEGAQVYVDPSGLLHDNGSSEERRDHERVRIGLESTTQTAKSRRGYLVTHGVRSNPSSRINTHLVLAESPDEAIAVWIKHFGHDQQCEIKSVELAPYGVIDA